jgi:hypothetical protein
MVDARWLVGWRGDSSAPNPLTILLSGLGEAGPCTHDCSQLHVAEFIGKKRKEKERGGFNGDTKEPCIAVIFESRAVLPGQNTTRIWRKIGGTQMYDYNSAILCLSSN